MDIKISTSIMCADFLNLGKDIKELEEAGAIKLDRHRIIITDKEALQKIIEVSS